MKKLMILGAGVYQFPIIEYACLHYNVVLVAPYIPEDIKQKVSKFYMLFAVITSLGALGFFKYTDFFIDFFAKNA